MCFRPTEMGGIEHRCPECGTNNLPEATMCANCFAPMEPLDIAALAAAAGMADAPSAPSAPNAPNAPKAPAAPKPPNAPTITFGASEPKADEPGVGEVFSF